MTLGVGTEVGGTDILDAPRVDVAWGDKFLLYEVIEPVGAVQVVLVVVVHRGWALVITTRMTQAAGSLRNNEHGERHYAVTTPHAGGGERR